MSARMAVGKKKVVITAMTFLILTGILFLLCTPVLASSSASVTVKVTVRPCIRVLPDGSVRSNVPVARTLGSGMFTVLPL